MKNNTQYKNGIIAAIRNQFGISGDTDGYKFSHSCLMPKDATNIQNYVESRGGEYDKLCWAGLQMIIKEYFFQQLTFDQVNNLVEFEKKYTAGNYTPDLEEALRVVVNEYNGYLPLRICAVQEGMIVPTKIALMTTELTVDDKRLITLPGYIEAKIQRVWNTTTVATKSWHMYQTIYAALQKTSDIPDLEIPWKMNDFGSRGVGAMEEAAFAGMGHFVSFMGSDTTVAVQATNLAYHAEMCGGTIGASEHSTTTAHGRGNERQLVEQMFDAYAKPGAIFATVIDSYDWISFIREIAPQFKDRLNKSGATWVFRPDSGNPVTTVLKVIEELDKVFGNTVNGKGYKVLNNVRCIQGDGITHVEMEQIIDLLIENGWSITNIAFGMGGGLLRRHDRDTLKFSMKCCAIKRNGFWFDVYKDPAVYDDEWNKLEEASFKKSKAGRLLTIYRDSDKSWLTIREDDMSKYIPEGYRNMMEVVYENGTLHRDMTLDQLKKNAGTA